jgi:hypothetical protein
MRIKTALAAFVAAISFAAIAAGGANAALVNFSQGLELTENGAPLASGSAVTNEQLTIDGHCVQESPGKLLNNDGIADIMQFSAPNWTECQSGSVSGAVKYVALSDTGTAILYMEPMLALTTSTGCTYDFALVTGTFPDSIEAYITGEAFGLRSFTSSHSCAPTLRTEFRAVELGSNIQPLGSELTNSPKF